MRKLALYLGLLCVMVFVSCAGDQAKTSANIQLVDDYVEAVENLDYDAMSNYLAEDYMGYGPSRNDSINKLDGVASWKLNVETLYEKIQYKRSRNMAVVVSDGDNAGEWVSNWAELEITYQGDLPSVTILANTIYKIENGKIARSFTFYNEADALEQLGYVFINPNEL